MTKGNEEQRILYYRRNVNVITDNFKWSILYEYGTK
jgi:hypothetical protein